MNSILPSQSRAAYDGIQAFHASRSEPVDLTAKEEETLAAAFPANPDVEARLYGAAADVWTAGAHDLGQHIDTVG